MTHSIEKANQLAAHKLGLAGNLFGELLDALSGKKKFDLNKLYELNHADFHLAMEVISDWRLHRHCYQAGPHEICLKKTSPASMHTH